MRNKALKLLAPEEEGGGVRCEEEEDAHAGCENLPTSYNELIITIHGCKGLKHSPSHNPNSYAMYKFYTFPDSDTPIVCNCRDPVFEDTQCFPLSVDQTLDAYLRREVGGCGLCGCHWILTVGSSVITAVVCISV